MAAALRLRRRNHHHRASCDNDNDNVNDNVNDIGNDIGNDNVSSAAVRSAFRACRSDIDTVLAHDGGDDDRPLHVVLTLGALGVVLSTRAHGHVHFPALRANVVSLVGAGDTLVAGTVVALSAGWDVAAAVAMGIGATTMHSYLWMYVCFCVSLCVRLIHMSLC